MDTQGRVNRLLRRLNSNGRATPTLRLYAEGFRVKLRQARFSLKMLRELTHLEDQPFVGGGTTIAPAQDSLTVSERVNYYCECFWDFLRSALDILGQLINELRSLGIAEQDVDFKRVADKMKLVALGSPLDVALDALRNSRAFNQLEDYRHCSTHRRHIYIETRTVTTEIIGSLGYYSASSAAQARVERYLSVNPWDVRPRVNGARRPVVQYCESLLRRIEKHMDRIINGLS